jgi:hypothetical protein
MNKKEAHELLTARRGGLAVLPSTINYALWLTGDLRADALEFGKGMAEETSGEGQGGGQSKGNDVVAQSGRYYGSQAWFDVHYGVKAPHEPNKEQQ